MLLGKWAWVWQWIIKRFFRRFGIDVARYYPSQQDYERCYPYAYETFAPWRQASFQKAYALVANRSTVTEDRMYMLCSLARHCLNFKGEFAECGVYQGASAYMVAGILALDGRPFHLFDTFAGMPPFAAHDPGGHTTGDFADTSLEAVKEFLSQFPFLEFHQGTMPETFEGLHKKSFSFVHVDVDLYQSVKDCCLFFYERLVPGGVMIFDDYGFRQYEHSARKAVDEFFLERVEKPISLHTGQCIIIKV